MRGKTLGLLLSVLIIANGAVAASRAGVQSPGVMFRVLHYFTGGTSDGGFPTCKPIMDRSGNLYGMVASGGAYGYGGVYKFTSHRGTYSLRLLHSFDGYDGAYSGSNELLLKNGTLYGEAASGGLYGTSGTLFSLGTDGSKFTTLYNFSGGDDGEEPFGGLVMDKSGNLYGVTSYGGTYGWGTVFEYSKGKLTTLVNMDASNTGYNPAARLNIDQAGNLWGTTHGGGGTDGTGTVFELKPNGKGGWSFHVVHRFRDRGGAFPGYGRVVFGKLGSVFGTAEEGGRTGYGVVYGLQKERAYKEIIAYNFSGGNDGRFPLGQVRLNKAGHLLGTTYNGGPSYDGNVFELTHANGAWHESVLHNFDGNDGCNPQSGLLLDKKGKAFGTTSPAGCTPQGGYGTLYEVSGIH